MEQRAYERYDSNAVINCRYLSDGTPVGGNMINYSESGLCFETPVPFIENSVVVVEIDSNNGNRSGIHPSKSSRSICVGEIKWCREIQSGSSPNYKAGLSYYRY